MEILMYILYVLAAVVALYVLGLLVIALAGLFVDMTKPIEKQSRFFRMAIVYVVPLFIYICGERARLVGKEKLPEGKFLMVSNHRSMFDPMTVMTLMVKYNVSFVSKPENLKIPVVGPAIYAAGSLPIDRENNREALKTILRAAEHIKSGLCNMMIYPEGTRSRTGELLPFHSGSFKIAQRAGCDLVITAIEGSEKVGKRIFLPTPVTLTVLETVPAEKVKEMSTDALAEYSEQLIKAHLGK